MTGHPAAAAEPWRGPLAHRLGLPPVEPVREGGYRARTVVTEEMLGGRTAAFGGWLTCLIDHVAGAATAMSHGSAAGFLTARLEVDFVRPVRCGAIILTATLQSVGARLVDVAVLLEQDGARCCTAQLTQVTSGGSSANRDPGWRTSRARSGHLDQAAGR
jgi:uncharacterized protein (TIGR00369 family)